MSTGNWIKLSVTSNDDNLSANFIDILLFSRIYIPRIKHIFTIIISL